jgi:hypothetical protein
MSILGSFFDVVKGMNDLNWMRVIEMVLQGIRMKVCVKLLQTTGVIKHALVIVTINDDVWNKNRQLLACCHPGQEACAMHLFGMMVWLRLVTIMGPYHQKQALSL